MMTDKQIIINGVDVSEWTDEEIRYNFEKHSPKAIRQIAFDLYKQLKHKKQECEELKSDLTDLSKIIDCKNGTILTFEEQLDRLKQTVAEIKEICNEHQKEYILNIGVEILTNKILQII